MSQQGDKLPSIKNPSHRDLNEHGAPANLQGRSEEDEWAKVSKYNYYMFKQEEQLAQMRRANKMVSMRHQLDEQIKEKERIKAIERGQEQSYINAEHVIRDIDTKKENAKTNLHKEKVKFEKEMRDRQMKEIQQRKE